MASTQQLKSRIRSVKSTKQITKAMQMVAASKLRRTQEAARASSPYEQEAQQLMRYLASQGATDEHPLFRRRKINRRLIILIASDKGLAGAYNANVLRRYVDLLKRDEERGHSTVTITLGRKASHFVARLKDAEVLGSYDDLPDQPGGAVFSTVLRTACELYETKRVDAVTVVYTQFQSSIRQESVWMRLLPAGTELMSDPSEVRNSISDARYEPNTPEVLNAVVYRLVGARLFQAMLDSRASEHSMRMLAMKNATDNATDLADDLTLAMNKARQGAITQELAEISGGAEAMK